MCLCLIETCLPLMRLKSLFASYDSSGPIVLMSLMNLKGLMSQCCHLLLPNKASHAIEQPKQSPAAVAATASDMYAAHGIVCSSTSASVSDMYV